MDEFSHDFARARTMFQNIRNELTYPENFLSSSSMMVDLKHFVETCLRHSSEFYNQVYLENYAESLINLLSPEHGKLLYDHWTRPFTYYENITGFSICFPNTREMYQEYLYENFYEDLDISIDTNWDDFIFTVYPPPSDPWYEIHIPEYYEVHLGPIDPTIDLHIFIDELAQFPEELHIGHTGVFNDFSMDVEIELPGAEFIDDLQWGTTTIILPVSSLSISKDVSEPTITIVVNATCAASASQDVNLTVRHIKEDSILWEDNQISSIDIGQDLTCNLSTSDNWTDLIEVPKVPQKSTGFIGPDKPIIEPIIVISFSITVLVIINKKFKKK
ncbi:MAG: hypothetical protein EAX90_10845 [Candidatus Heimdallarchaeota archaeon]|nr:hypothetical protein [Candidatus Heimdallarchaeota archaeon]